ncbi:MAG TPA: FAD-binding oxidoreductase [Candidatus Limnocylindria bacterium]|nr:FAD-binding oxidoreductase [Candidatus Limnocylindria bacterium]
MNAISRRAFLRAAAIGAVSATLGCATTAQPSPTPVATPSATLPATPAPTPTPRPSPTWDALAAKLRGPLIRPADATYDGARVLYNTRFDAVRPQAIARCASVEDVSECVRFARTFGVPLSLRSGGHSYGGWSTGTGLVLDVSPLDTIAVGDGRVTAGAGARLIDVYAAVAARGVGIAAGSCPTVGITGLTLGGGIGVLTRAWGLTCDDLVAAQVVTADAQVHECDENRDADLFWALRGGGGGNFGVVTSLTLRTHPVGDLALGFLTWPWARAAAVVASWQDWMSRAPDALWSTLHLEAGSEGAAVSIHGVHAGTAREISTLLDGLVAAAGAPSYRESGTRTYRDVMLLEAGCLGRSVAQCHLQGTNGEGQLGRETYLAKSAVATRPLTPDAIRALVDGVGSMVGRSGVGGGAVLLDSLGGAVARIAPSATAFPHRDAFAVAQFIGSWDAAAPAAAADATATWLRQLYATARPLIGRGAYVNYADAELSDWEDAYYGANYARLRQIKARYDPDRLFDFPQAVRA